MLALVDPPPAAAPELAALGDCGTGLSGAELNPNPDRGEGGGRVGGGVVAGPAAADVVLMVVVDVAAGGATGVAGVAGVTGVVTSDEVEE